MKPNKVKRVVTLTKEFMEKYGKMKDNAKVSWPEFVGKVERGEIK